MDNLNDHIGNRTHEPPPCSAVPQLTAPPRTPSCLVIYDVSLPLVTGHKGYEQGFSSSVDAGYTRIDI